VSAGSDQAGFATRSLPSHAPAGLLHGHVFAALAWSGFDNPKKRRAEGIGLDDSSILERVAAGLVHF
jgi:hypothetical protein